jgi:hypothetical protein
MIAGDAARDAQGLRSDPPRHALRDEAILTRAARLVRRERDLIARERALARIQARRSPVGGPTEPGSV